MLGLLAGAAGAWLAARFRAQAVLARARARAESERAVLEERLAAREQALAEQRALLQEAERKLADTFRALSGDALQKNNQAFLDLAKTILERFQNDAQNDLEKRQLAVHALVTPIRESLDKVDGHLRDLEGKRQDAYVELRTQVRQMAEAQTGLIRETQHLAQALRAPSVAGAWGELQLQRILELAGLLPHVTYTLRQNVAAGDERAHPDCVVQLPGGKTVIIDAKAPLRAYLDALAATEESVRRNLLAAHARNVRAHMAALAAKAYWQHFDPAPEFVVMFVPSEAVLLAALQTEPGLLEDGLRNHVILATPTTLMALLQTVAFAWRQEKLAANAEAICALGRELYDRLRVFTGHLEDMGGGLDTAVKSYNKAVGSLETRVLASARRFADYGIQTPEEMPRLEGVGTPVKDVK